MPQFSVSSDSILTTGATILVGLVAGFWAAITSFRGQYAKDVTRLHDRINEAHEAVSAHKNSCSNGCQVKEGLHIFRDELHTLRGEFHKAQLDHVRLTTTLLTKVEALALRDDT